MTIFAVFFASILSKVKDTILLLEIVHTNDGNLKQKDFDSVKTFRAIKGKISKIYLD